MLRAILSTTGFSLLLLSGSALAAEHGGHSTPKAVMSSHAPSGAKMPATTHWSYEGDEGPEFWGSLSPGYHACAQGRAQSPMDISQAEGAVMHSIHFDYKVAELSMVNNGHTVQFNYPKGSSIMVGGKQYHLKQFHFHTPSEHTVGGQSFPMEIHFVHASDDGELAVVGVMVAEGNYNLAAQEIWDRMPRHSMQKTMDSHIIINARDLQPNDKRYYRYMGSLTTPPCTEGVNWFLLTTPIEMSADQIQDLHNIMGRNARPVQMRNNRMLFRAQSTR